MAMEATVEKVIWANSEFASGLYKEITKTSAESNLFFSPFSLSAALSMVLVGARKNTELEMINVLGYKDVDRTVLNMCYSDILSSAASALTVANRIFLQEDFDLQETFRQVLETNYLAGCTKINFSDSLATSVINEWVQKETGGKIISLVNSLSPNTAMIIANAIYFKSFWNKKFEVDNTQVEPFYIKENESINVKMMYQSNRFGLSFHERTKTQVLKLDHSNEKTSMLIFLPAAGKLQELEMVFGRDLLEEVLSNISIVKTKVWIPRFKLEETYNLKSLLINMGISDLFSAHAADLSGIGKNIFASEVVHKSFVQVNEEGTEAAAASGVILMKRSLELEAEFRADRPFLFCILDKHTKNILFLGRLAKPEAVSASEHDEL